MFPVQLRGGASSTPCQDKIYFARYKEKVTFRQFIGLIYFARKIQVKFKHAIMLIIGLSLTPIILFFYHEDVISFDREIERIMGRKRKKL